MPRGARRLVLATVACLGTASTQAVVARAQIDASTSTIELRDAVTVEPLADQLVEVTSHNGIVCNRAPCPMSRGGHWRGRSDSRGLIVVPDSLFLYDTQVQSAGRYASLRDQPRPSGGGPWIVGLARAVADERGPRPFRLIDVASGRPVANADARIEYPGPAASRLAHRIPTNALGFALVPDAIAVEAGSQLLIIVPGYRPARIYLAQIGRTTALRPR